MRSNRSKLAKLTTALLIACTCGSSGCDAAYRFLGSNFNLSIIVPTGFGGNPGFYNPFGITQAIVNAFLGANTSSGGESSEDSNAAPSTIPATLSGVNAALN